jgi:hypothetical protein
MSARRVKDEKSFGEPEMGGGGDTLRDARSGDELHEHGGRRKRALRSRHEWVGERFQIVPDSHGRRLLGEDAVRAGY